jgi:hypothetical protein
MTEEVTIGYLKIHYGDVYEFAKSDEIYTARALFGAHDLLTAGSPAELRLKVRQHYPGTSADLCST